MALLSPSRLSIWRLTQSVRLRVRKCQTTAGSSELNEEPSPLTLELHGDTFRAHNCEPPSLEVQTTKRELLAMYKEMQTIRRMEMASESLYKADLVQGYCHLSIGQEAVAVGIEHGIEKNDRVITSYRCHPFALLRGGTLEGIIGELIGRQCGMSHGRGGSMHLFTSTFFGGNGIVGAQVPIGSGIAFAQKYRGEKHCTFVLYGDGASNQGQVFEAFNMARLWNLPCIFVCENNKYAMGTASVRSSSNPEYFTRGDKIPGLRVNAMDVIATKQAAEWARKWTVEEKKGPLLLEFVTYRFGGHSVSLFSSLSDPSTTYRTCEEIRHMRDTLDPLRILQRYITDQGVATQEELKQLNKEAKAEVDTAVANAKQSPEVREVDLWTDIYYRGTEPPAMRGRESAEVHNY